MTERSPLLTTAERNAVQAAGELWNQLCRIVGDGPTRDADLAELIGHVHSIQHTVLANAAARAYPDLYRRLGETLQADGEHDVSRETSEQETD